MPWPSDYCWSKWRLFTAFQEQHKRYKQLEFWREYFTKSRLNVFLSPLHREQYLFVMPEIESHETFLSPPPVDGDLFKPHPEGWQPNTGATINLLQFKGLYLTHSFLSEQKHIQWSILGNIRENVNLPPHVKYLGVMSQKKLAETLGKCETYAELSDTSQPYNQTLVQGFISCKRVVTNRMVGASSWSWFRKGGQDECREAMRQAMPDLWARLEKEVGAS